MNKKDLPQGYIPSVKDAEWFLNYWKNLPSYSNQEKALEKLFKKFSKNDNIEDILIKCSSLNDFYSTNIFDIHTVAQHILSLNIDERLESGDKSLVNEIAHVKVNGKDHFFYSFATKYCSHHQPYRYAIYDSYVEKVLLTMKEREKRLAKFNRDDLKDYGKYMDVIEAFQQTFSLTQYNIKQLDQYLWQLGKWYFNNYGLIYKYYNREDENPYSKDDIRNKFWEGEMMFVTTHQKVGEWKEAGKSCLKCANEQVRSLAARLTPEQFGVVIYISTLFGKWCPYEEQSWLIEY